MATGIYCGEKREPIKMYDWAEIGQDPSVKSGFCLSDLMRIIIGLAGDNGTVTRCCVSSRAYNYDCVEMLMAYCFGHGNSGQYYSGVFG